MSLHSTSSPVQCLTDRGEDWGTNVVWKSFEIEEWQRFLRYQRDEIGANKETKGLLFVPSSFRTHPGDRLRNLNNKIKDLKVKIAAKEQGVAERERKSGRNVLPIFGGKDLSRATELFAQAIQFGTVEGVIRGSCLDSDDNFTTQAEFLLGEELLREL